MSDQIHQRGRAAPDSWRRWLVGIAQAVRFFSRLPIPRLPFESGDAHAAPAFSDLVRVVPVAGLIIAILPGLVLVLGLGLAFGPFLSAALAVATLTLMTGGLHEDGLSDTADSFGGTTRERRLEIMRDSRIGSFGASALVLAFALRIGALAEIAGRSTALDAMLALAIAASLSRTAALMPLSFLPPARSDGAAHAVGRPGREASLFAAALAAGLAWALGFLTEFPLAGSSLMIAFAGAVGWFMTRFAERHLGGQTGDIAGATQQLAEIAALIGLLIALR